MSQEIVDIQIQIRLSSIIGLWHDEIKDEKFWDMCIQHALAQLCVSPFSSEEDWLYSDGKLCCITRATSEQVSLWLEASGISQQSWNIEWGSRGPYHPDKGSVPIPLYRDDWSVGEIVRECQWGTGWMYEGMPFDYQPPKSLEEAQTLFQNSTDPKGREFLLQVMNFYSTAKDSDQTSK